MPKLSVEQIYDWLNSVISTENCIGGDINFIFCSDNYLLNINEKYLKHNYYTDVITFDYTEGNIISGDIFISTDRVFDNSNQFSITFTHELNRIMIHGLLHLLGYNDKIENDKLQMTNLENKYLELLD